MSDIQVDGIGGKTVPYGMAWPLYEDGTPVKIGDIAYISGEPHEVRSIIFNDGGWVISGGGLHEKVLHGRRMKRAGCAGDGLDEAIMGEDVDSKDEYGIAIRMNDGSVQSVSSEWLAVVYDEGTITCNIEPDIDDIQLLHNMAGHFSRIKIDIGDDEEYSEKRYIELERTTIRLLIESAFATLYTLGVRCGIERATSSAGIMESNIYNMLDRIIYGIDTDSIAEDMSKIYDRLR